MAAGLLVLALLLAAPFSAAFAAEPPAGPVLQDQVKALASTWLGPEPVLKPEAVRMLGGVQGKTAVKVFFGAWDDQSRRELPRLLKIVALARATPLAVEYIAVDRDLKQPAKALKENDVRYLPTFIVSRQGREVGRIVERSPRGLETDLALLLTSKATGLISGSEEVIWSYLAAAALTKTTPPGGVVPASLTRRQEATSAIFHPTAASQAAPAPPPP